VGDSSSSRIHEGMYAGKEKHDRVYVALYVIVNMIAHVQVCKQFIGKI
jgi:hypothetical protein